MQEEHTKVIIMSEKSKIFKNIILEILDYLRYKVENDRLTLSETESIARTIESGLDLQGTVEDFSRFYGHPRTNISSVINRRMIEKPVRRVSYSFGSFRKIVPDRWRDHRQNADDQRSRGNA